MEVRMDILDADKLIRIREFNDKLRRYFVGGKVMLTDSVAELPDMVKAAALLFMAQYHNFTTQNDPYGEHDFGAFELCNRRFFWKVDCLTIDSQSASEDPADPSKTQRVLTLMLDCDW
jgi:hypothetical protein